ncbi:hypothetical protein [Pelobacter seleniigenes]|uniref:hypothetical protein n=1 Tax=Pelobacter seleniigenes TaxID=407188 RepID=UPI0004A6CF1F|nr:hypothetical protein [Pelobacter seleniigenes]
MIFFILLVLATSVQAAQPIQITISTMTEASSTKATVTAYLQKLLEERSNKRIQVHLINNPALTADQLVQSLQTTETQLAIPEINKLHDQAVALKALELPFLYRSRQHLHQIIDSNIGTQLLSSLEQNNLKFLGIWDEGPEQIAGNRELPADSTLFFSDPAEKCCLTSQRRSPEAGHQVSGSWQELTLGEIESAISRQAFSDITLTNHRLSGHALLVQRSFWNGLPEDLKIIIQEAVVNATEYATEMADKADQDAYAKLRQQDRINIHPVGKDSRKLWQKKVLQYIAECCGPTDTNLLYQAVY